MHRRLLMSLVILVLSIGPSPAAAHYRAGWDDNDVRGRLDINWVSLSHDIRRIYLSVKMYGDWNAATLANRNWHRWWLETDGDRWADRYVKLDRHSDGGLKCSVHRPSGEWVAGGGVWVNAQHPKWKGCVVSRNDARASEETVVRYWGASRYRAHDDLSPLFRHSLP